MVAHSAGAEVEEGWEDEGRETVYSSDSKGEGKQRDGSWWVSTDGATSMSANAQGSLREEEGEAVVIALVRRMHAGNLV